LKTYYASQMLEQDFGRKSVAANNKAESKLSERVSPVVRSDCPKHRPCPYVTCRYNLYLDIRASGNITFNFSDMPIEMVRHSCSLDIANEHELGLPLGKIGEIMNLTRERVRQIELEATEKINKILL